MAEKTVEQAFDRVFSWGRAQARDGQRCRVLLRGSTGHAVQVQFEDGVKMIVSTRAAKRPKKK